MTSRERLKNIIHFICRECGMTPDRLGKVKLHKIIYYSDLERFKRKAQGITGAVFVKNLYGPFIREMDEILAQLQKEGRLQIIPRDEYDEFDNVGLVGKGTPILDEFEDREISIVKEQIEKICAESATYISDKSHGPVWEMAAMGEIMPLEAEIAVSLIDTTLEDIKYAENLKI